MAKRFYENLFTPAVQAFQEQQGSQSVYARQLLPEAPAGDRLGPQESQFIAQRDGFYQATVSAGGWPYVQFRGGPRGFLKVLDAQTLAFADFRGNRQYISTGNLTENDRIAMILMDYPNQARLKILGHVRLVDQSEDPSLIARLHDPSYKARPERAFVITLEGFDWNCPQHIPQRLTLEEMQSVLTPIQTEIVQLRAENAALQEQLRAAQGDKSEAP